MLHILCAQLCSDVQLIVTPCMDCQAPLSVGILQERILEWDAMPLSRESSQPKGLPRSLTLQVDSLPSEPARKPIYASSFYLWKLLDRDNFLSLPNDNKLLLCIYEESLGLKMFSSLPSEKTAFDLYSFFENQCIFPGSWAERFLTSPSVA